MGGLAVGHGMAWHVPGDGDGEKAKEKEVKFTFAMSLWLSPISPNSSFFPFCFFSLLFPSPIFPLDPR